MPTCNYCGQANAGGTTTCMLCGQLLLPGERPAADSAAAAPSDEVTPGEQPASRYDAHASAGQEAPPPGWGPPSDAEPPPPGWGPAGASSWGAAPSRVGEPIRTKKQSKLKSSEVLSYAKVVAVLAILAVVAYLFLGAQLSKTTLDVTITDRGATSVAGDFTVLDANGTTLGSKKIDDKGDECTWGRFYTFKVQVKKAPSYVFSYKDVTTNELDAATVASAKNEVTIDVNKRVEASTNQALSC